jgi:hypothetical protein
MACAGTPSTGGYPPDAAPPRSLLVLGLRHRSQVHREREGKRWEEAEDCNSGKGDGGSPREGRGFSALAPSRHDVPFSYVSDVKI